MVDQVLQLGGLSSLLRLLESSNPHVYASSVAVLCSMLRVAPMLNEALYRLGIAPMLVSLLSEEKIGSFDDHLNAVVCLQTSALLLTCMKSQYLHDISLDLVQHGLPAHLVRILRQAQELWALDSSIEAKIGHHCLLTVISIIGQLLHVTGEATIRSCFIQMGLLEASLAVFSRLGTELIQELSGWIQYIVGFLWRMLYSAGESNQLQQIECAIQIVMHLPRLLIISTEREKYWKINGVTLLIDLLQDSFVSCLTSDMKDRFVSGFKTAVMCLLFAGEEHAVRIEALRTTTHFVRNVTWALGQHDSMTTQLLPLISLVSHYGRDTGIYDDFIEIGLMEELVQIVSRIATERKQAFMAMAIMNQINQRATTPFPISLDQKIQLFDSDCDIPHAKEILEKFSKQIESVS